MPERPRAGSRSLTAPSKMSVNGHFASVGDNREVVDYEHGVQVIDEDKEFKYGLPPLIAGRNCPSTTFPPVQALWAIFCNVSYGT